MMMMMKKMMMSGNKNHAAAFSVSAKRSFMVGLSASHKNPNPFEDRAYERVAHVDATYDWKKQYGGTAWLVRSRDGDVLGKGAKIYGKGSLKGVHEAEMMSVLDYAELVRDGDRVVICNDRLGAVREIHEAWMAFKAEGGRGLFERGSRNSVFSDGIRDVAKLIVSELWNTDAKLIWIPNGHNKAVHLFLQSQWHVRRATMKSSKKRFNLQVKIDRKFIQRRLASAAKSHGDVSASAAADDEDVHVDDDE